MFDFLYQITEPITKAVAFIFFKISQFLPEEAAQALMVCMMVLACYMPFIIIGIILIVISYIIWKWKTRNHTRKEPEQFYEIAARIDEVDKEGE